MGAFSPGDYVQSVVKDFYENAIWIVREVRGDMVLCSHPFELTEHIKTGVYYMISNGFYTDEVIAFREHDLVTAIPLVVRAKLTGCKIPTLGNEYGKHIRT